MCAREIVLPNASKLKTLRKGEEMERLREKRKSVWDIKRKSWGPTDGQTDLGYGGKQERSVTWKTVNKQFFDHILNYILHYEYLDCYVINSFQICGIIQFLPKFYLYYFFHLNGIINSENWFKYSYVETCIRIWNDG